MSLKFLRSTGTFLITIWTVPMARSAVPAGLAFRATFARSTGCSQAARLYLPYPLGLNTAVHQRLPSGSVVQKHK